MTPEEERERRHTMMRYTALLACWVAAWIIAQHWLIDLATYP